MAADREFADYCCELLSVVGPCVPKRMFGGWGISVDGLNIAFTGDFGEGQRLWLKGNDDTRARYEAAGCTIASYVSTRGGVSQTHTMNYFSAPEDAMDSPDAMTDWARLAMQCALKAKAAKPAKSSKPRLVKTKAPAKSLAMALTKAPAKVPKKVRTKGKP